MGGPGRKSTARDSAADYIENRFPEQRGGRTWTRLVGELPISQKRTFLTRNSFDGTELRNYSQREGRANSRVAERFEAARLRGPGMDGDVFARSRRDRLGQSAFSRRI